MKKELWRQYIKTKVCIVLILLFFLFTYIFTLFLIRLGTTGFSLLHTMARYNYYMCFVLSCISYLFVSRANVNGVKEVSDTLGGRGIYEKNALYIMMIQTVIWNVGMYIMLIICSALNDGTHYFIRWFTPNFIYNVFVPQMICILLTCFVAESRNTMKWLMVECVFLFIISPFAEVFVWKQKPHIPIDQIWKIIRWPFQILYQNGEWSPDYQNDLQLEPVRIYVLFFWLLLLVGIWILQIWKRKKTGAALVLISVVFLVMSFQPSSLYCLNSSWDGINRDYTEYKIHTENNKQQDGQETFTVNKYDLKVAMNNELCVNGTISVEADTALNEFMFTLYRGYHVKKVKSLDKKIKITYQQMDDQLIIWSDCPVKKMQIQMSYSGHHDKFYSNSNAAILPGWFPWYPMAGMRSVVCEYLEYGKMWGYNPYNRIPKTEITVETSGNILTNLKEVKKGIYEGKTDSITILKGNIVETGDEKIVDALPLELYNGYGVSEFEEQQEKIFDKAIQKLQSVYGVDTTFLTNKPIIFASKDLGRNMTNNFFSVFDNYILASPDYTDENEILHYMILGDSKNRKRRENSELMQIIMNSYFGQEPENLVKEWVDEAKNRQENPQMYEKRFEEAEEFVEVLEKVDSSLILKEAVQYVLNPEKYEDDRTFLNTMRKKYD